MRRFGLLSRLSGVKKENACTIYLVEKHEGENVEVAKKLNEKKEELNKKWNNFLVSLNKEERRYFEKGKYFEARKYFEAIKNVSDICIDKIDEKEERKKINDSIKTILDFINNHKDYYELSKVVGFRENDGSISGRDYYYYIADQQIKATVYYARYLNFIVDCEITEEREEEICKGLQEICKQLGVQSNCLDKDDNVKCMCECLVKQIDNQSDNLEDTDIQVSNFADNGQLTLGELNEELLQYLEKYKLSKNIEYKLYMMLNNMMHEIRFFGAAYQYRWHWKSYKKTLYRSGSLEKKDGERKQGKNDDITMHEFMKNMFKECIDHMNSPSQSRHSFSENLLIDVYKYLILKKPIKNEVEPIVNEKGLCITCKSIKNENKVEFHIVKDASINSVFVDNSVQDFYAFIQNKKIPADYGYTVEIYPQGFQGEKNNMGTVKGMRDTLLPLYFKSWGLDIALSKTKVADDKEVITYGKFYSKKIEDIDANKVAFSEADDNDRTLFSMSLDKEEIIKLLLLIYQKKKHSDDAIEKIVEKINKGMNYNSSLKGKFESLFDDTGEWNQQLIYNRIVSNPFIIDINVKKDYLDSMSDDGRKNLKSVSNEIDQKIRGGISKFLTSRYKEILEKDNTKIKFIMSTMENKDFNFGLVSQYNEYMVVGEDSEIAMLKYIIFKEDE